MIRTFIELAKKGKFLIGHLFAIDAKSVLCPIFRLTFKCNMHLGWSMKLSTNPFLNVSF